MGRVGVQSAELSVLELFRGCVICVTHPLRGCAAIAAATGLNYRVIIEQLSTKDTRSRSESRLLMTHLTAGAVITLRQAKASGRCGRSPLKVMGFLHP